MLLYLATNTHPDIAFAVSQVARFNHTPRKQSHTTAIKAIVHSYLNRNAFSDTVMDDKDMASAAASGVAKPISAMGTISSQSFQTSIAAAEPASLRNSNF